MSLTKIKNDLVGLCKDVMDGEYPDDINERITAIRRQIIESPEWIQKTEHLQIKILNNLFNLPRPDALETRWLINKADGFLDEALRIDKAERDKGIPKPIDKSPDTANCDLLEDSISLENWLSFHGEGQIGPSWWMDNYKKDPDSWTPNDVAWLNKELQKWDGILFDCRFDDCKYVFRFLGKGSWDRGVWVATPEGREYLFAVFTLENDPKKSVLPEDDLDINLERWLDAFGEEEYPARFMCPTEGRPKMYALNKKLKALDGTPVGDSHVWIYCGKRTYKREGKLDLFKCEPK